VVSTLNRQTDAVNFINVFTYKFFARTLFWQLFLVTFCFGEKFVPKILAKNVDEIDGWMDGPTTKLISQEKKHDHFQIGFRTSGEVSSIRYSRNPFSQFLQHFRNIFFAKNIRTHKVQK